mgnify:CR=1 FL=1
MAVIHVLDHQTIDKIAAGEVVERPASVVKELVENAIDAGASAVTVEIKDGGSTLIRVTDNGGGIEKSQVCNAFLRHATSKITTAEDLTDLVSLGFRGEALASIAAVSMVELISKTADDLTGIRYVIEGGAEKAREEIGAPEGTTIIVRNLFYNTPPRKKFLKQPQTEGAYVADLMEHLAMSNSGVAFKFIANGQTRFFTAGNNDLKEIVYRIYGKEIAAQLMPFCFEKEGVSINGLLGRPVINRANRSYEIFYINGRYIKSTLISKSVEEGYKGYLMQHKFPFCVLHFGIDTGRIDVNVHPTKMEVRIADAPDFYDTVKNAVYDTLHAAEMIPEISLAEDKCGKAKNSDRKMDISVPEPFEQNRRAKAEAEAQRRVQEAVQPAAKSPVQSAAKSLAQSTAKPPVQPFVQTTQPVRAASIERLYRENKKAQSSTASSGTASYAPENVQSKNTDRLCENTAYTAAECNNTAGEECGYNLQAENRPQSVNHQAFMDGETAAPKASQQPVQMELFDNRILSEQAKSRYEIIGQLFDTYWLISYEDKLLIIDQHAAHEKVKYERFMQHFKEQSVMTQQIIPPLIVTLSAREKGCYTAHADDFAALGYTIEGFGGNDYAIRGVPLDLYGYEGKDFFHEILDELMEENVTGTPEGIRARIATMACKAAVKGNMRLTVSEAQELINELMTLDNPYHCPHGRPTIVSMTKYELEKKFKRIVT